MLLVSDQDVGQRAGARKRRRVLGGGSLVVDGLGAAHDGDIRLRCADVVDRDLGADVCQRRGEGSGQRTVEGLATEDATAGEVDDDGAFAVERKQRFAVGLRLVGLGDEIRDGLTVDVVEKVADVKLDHRVVHPGDGGWSVLHGTNEDGHLIFHIDRNRKVITVELVPFVPQVEDALRHYVMNVYKPQLKDASIVSSHILWELHVR